jgi:hypothetical protein
MKNLIILILIFSFAAIAQKNDPDKILDRVVKEFKKVEDYTVNVKVKLDVPFIKAPDTEATIYFKQPDKIHFASEQFALVPREGLDFSPMGLLKSDYTSVYVREEEFNGEEHSVIKIIPLEDRGDVILSTLWIDTEKNIISKVESATKTSGTFIMELYYENDFKYPLPSSMIFIFNFKGMPGKRNKVNIEDQENKDETITGKVYINYSGYQINKGIPDSVFEEKKNK